jgi:hypothetical protein
MLQIHTEMLVLSLLHRILIMFLSVFSSSPFLFHRQLERGAVHFLHLCHILYSYMTFHIRDIRNVKHAPMYVLQLLFVLIGWHPQKAIFWFFVIYIYTYITDFTKDGSSVIISRNLPYNRRIHFVHGKYV